MGKTRRLGQFNHRQSYCPAGRQGRNLYRNLHAEKLRMRYQRTRDVQSPHACVSNFTNMVAFGFCSSRVARPFRHVRG